MLTVIPFADDRAACFQRLKLLFDDPMTEINLLFYQSALQVFIRFNMFLQREHSLLPVLYEELLSFLKKVESEFLKVSVLRDLNDMSTLNFSSRESQLAGN